MTTLHENRADRPSDPLTVYTADEAALILKVKPSWLERQAAARRIPFTMLGGAYRFTAEHLRQILAEFEQTPNPTRNPSGSKSTRRGRVDSSMPVPLLRPRPSARRQQRVA